MSDVIKLDIGCGGNKQKGFTGIDVRDMEGVDIVHDLEIFPWPIFDEVVILAVASHVLEHIKPWFSIPFMDEVWRVLLPGGTFAASMPYPGSRGFWQDPTHCNGWNEATFQYFDPRYPLYRIYMPSPWKIKKGFPVYQMAGNLEIILEKPLIGEEIEVEEGETLGISVAESINIKEVVG